MGKKKLKIAVIENDLSSYGGRHITFVDGFYGAFKEMGHDVKVMGFWSDKLLHSKEELIEKSICNLSPEDIILYRKRTDLIDKHLNLLEEQDFIFSTIINFKVLSVVNTVPIAYWLIASPHINVRKLFNLGTTLKSTNLPHNTYIWTNSYHQREEAEIPIAEVIYPPHDYSSWRKNAKPWNKREIDIVLATGITKGKIGKHILSEELKYIDEVTKKFGLKTVGLFACRNDRKYEWKLVENLSFETHTNVSRHEVAKYMGNSKIFFHPSPLECAALVNYEALNAGCYPVVRRAGACEEQLGQVGVVFNALPNDGFWQWIKEDIIPMDYNIKWSQIQGFKFDRVNIMPKINELVKKYVKDRDNKK